MSTFTLDVSGSEKYILEINTSTADQFTKNTSQDKFFLEIEQGSEGVVETTKNVIEITTSTSQAETYDITVVRNNDINLIISTDSIVSHPTISAASSVNNNGNIFIQDIYLDQYGHITGIASAAATGTGIGIVSTFLDLVDTPSSYSGYSNYLLSINSVESGIEFIKNKAKRQYRTIYTNDTLTNNDDIVLLDSSTQILHITMPYATGLDGYTLTIKKIAGNNNCIINSQSGEYIDSEQLLNIHYINESFSLFSNGNNWYIV